ncbi:MAG: HAD-IC family P-type ATPase [Patescibacteria group bacterium]|nr:HAD-IC family P-type ATPase [Patescibacteria group bacterium]MDD4611127.1 HAD-IC family P-type ATPase [Patescibacteria group bacterium]
MQNFHAQTIEYTLKELKTSKIGLNKIEAENRLKIIGPNVIEEEKKQSRLAIFLEQFKSPLIVILLIAGAISLLLRDFVDGGVIFGTVLLNTLIGFFQENKANQALAKLKKIIEHKAIILRDGHEVEVDSGVVVPGDIIILKSGNRVPADARLVEAINLQADEAALTGESIPSSKSTAKILEGAPLADRENMVYAGTIVVAGEGRGVITATGGNTEIGKIAKMVEATEEEKTPLQLKLSGLSKYIGILVTIICFLVFLIGIFQGRKFLEMFTTSIAIAVASIPEGLAVAVTVILVIGMQKILKEKALTRRLVSAETLGSTTVICTDKTGTLTLGKMHVHQIIVGDKEFNIKHLAPEMIKEEAKHALFALQIGALCNDAIIENPKDALLDWRLIGTPTETALLSAAYQSGLDKGKLLQAEPKIGELPFASEYKYMVTLHGRNRDEYVLYEKGAPELLIDKSVKYYSEGKLKSLTGAEKKKLIKIYESLTSQGLRVIGVAFKEAKKKELADGEFKKIDWNSSKNHKDWELIDNNLIFVGFISLKDPLREEAAETIKICREAGIRPVIITGDHQLTARAIGMEVGLKIKNDNIITGEELDKVNDDKLREAVKRVDIYARVSPHHKLRIVKALQANGEVVAMTGDGINDTPALKAADIGVALGTGADVAKESSDLVLLDCDFRTIVSAVKEGRIIFSNIRKVLTYLISDSFTEVILIVGSIMFGSPLAILPAQILWINIVNDGLPNFALAMERGEKGIMKDKPISKHEPIINREMKIIIFAVGIIRDLFALSIFIYLWKSFFVIAHVQTIIFALIGLDSLLYIFALRSFCRPVWRINPFGNLYVVGAVLFSFLLLIAAIYLKPMQMILSTVALNFHDWLIVVSFAFINLIMVEMVKIYYNTKEKRIKFGKA